MNMSVGRLVALGEGMIEVSGGLGGPARLNYGGDVVNTAVYLARLGAPVALATAVGLDPFSDELVASWSGEGVDGALIARHPTRLPGLYAIRTDDQGERTFYYWREQSAARDYFNLPDAEARWEGIGGASILYLSGITLAIFPPSDRERIVHLAQAVRARGGDVAFDPNYRARQWFDPHAARAAIEALAPFVTIALPTLEDECALRGDHDALGAIAYWRSFGAREVAVKIGKAGAVVWDGAEAVPVAPSEIVERPVDTTGAGDSFNAAYLHARLSGHDAGAAARRGCALAGHVVRHPGAVIARAHMPALDELCV